MNPVKNRVLKAAALPLASLYGLGIISWQHLHQWGWLRSRHLRNPVISVGNITTGGTGKTPLVEYLARLLQDQGHEVSILCRGYRRETLGVLTVSRGQGPVLDAIACGDEPFLLASHLPQCRVTVAEERFAAGELVEKQTETCVHLLDDGYQHLSLARNLNILLLDATDPFGGNHLLPWGRLREPLSAISRADVIIVTRADHPFEERTLVRRIKTINLRAPIIYAHHEVEGLIEVGSCAIHGPREFFRRPVGAFAGVASPQLFFDDLSHYQIEIALRHRFRDHHVYNQEELDRLSRDARMAGAEALVTTEKDAINMRGLTVKDLPTYYLRIQAHLHEATQLDFALQEILA